MPTVITQTIGTGGTYSGTAAIQNWYNGIGGSAPSNNLVAADVAMVGQIIGNLSFTGGNAALETAAIGPYTTDATHTITLTGQTPESYSGGLSWNTSRGPSVTSDGSVTTIAIGQANFILTGLQIQNSVGAYALDLSSNTALISSCIFETKGVSFTPISVHCNTTGGIIRNCLINLNTGNNACVWSVSGDTTVFQFCTIAIPSDNAAVTRMVYCPGNASFTNCTFFAGGTTTTFNDGGGTPTFSNCATDFASPPAGTAWQSGLTYANQFNGVTIAGGLDWRQKSATDGLYAHGIAISGVTTDIAGTTRKATPDIGAWEIAASTGSHSMPLTPRGRLFLDNRKSYFSFAGLVLPYAATAFVRNPRMGRRRFLRPHMWINS